MARTLPFLLGLACMMVAAAVLAQANPPKPPAPNPLEARISALEAQAMELDQRLREETLPKETIEKISQSMMDLGINTFNASSQLLVLFLTAGGVLAAILIGGAGFAYARLTTAIPKDVLTTIRSELDVLVVRKIGELDDATASLASLVNARTHLNVSFSWFELYERLRKAERPFETELSVAADMSKQAREEIESTAFQQGLKGPSADEFKRTRAHVLNGFVYHRTLQADFGRIGDDEAQELIKTARASSDHSDVLKPQTNFEIQDTYATALYRLGNAAQQEQARQIVLRNLGNERCPLDRRQEMYDEFVALGMQIDIPRPE